MAGLGGRWVIPESVACWLGERALDGAPAEVREAIARQPFHRDALAPHRARYVAEVSRTTMALSLPSAAFLAAWIEVAKPARVLDAGSGFSSLVLARAAQNHGTEVLVFDDDDVWLAKTEAFVRASFATERVRYLRWDLETLRRAGRFDLAIHDLGGMRQRARTLSSVLRAVEPGGWVFADDAHKLIYRAVLAWTLRSASPQLPLAPWTMDATRRHAVFAKTANPAPNGASTLG